MWDLCCNSGVSVATAATIGVVAIPEMIERGYNRKFVYGLLAAGGTLGILIPAKSSYDCLWFYY